MYAESLAQTLILHLLKNYTVIGSLRHAAPTSGGLPGFKLRLAKEFINEHLAEEITLAEVAGAAGLSQFHFARAFRRSSALTPQQYLIFRRIQRAKELLINGDLPLVQVSIQAGFKNQSHFTRAFSKVYRAHTKSLSGSQTPLSSLPFSQSEQTKSKQGGATSSWLLLQYV